MQLHRAAVALICLGTLLGLSACGSTIDNTENGSESKYLYEYTKVMTDGRSVDCVAILAGYYGGLSCDWDNAEKR